MNPESPKSITQILQTASNGDPKAAEHLWMMVYDELRAIARQQLAHESPGQTLQTTALVNEAYLRLIGDEQVQWENRRHFFGAAAQAMRRIRVDAARRRKRLKRGGDWKRIAAEEGVPVTDENPDLILAVDEAVDRLEAMDARRAEVVKLRFFAGLRVEDVATALGVSPRTVELDWQFARAWLHRELKHEIEPA